MTQSPYSGQGEIYTRACLEQKPNPILRGVTPLTPAIRNGELRILTASNLPGL